MKIIRSLNDFHALPESPVQAMVAERIAMLEEFGPYVPTLGWFVIVETGDVDVPVDAPCPSLLEDGDGLHFGDRGYFSPFEFCTRHDSGIFELVRVLSDSGEAVAVFVPDAPGISTNLLLLCRTFQEICHAHS